MVLQEADSETGKLLTTVGWNWIVSTSKLTIARSRFVAWWNSIYWLSITRLQASHANPCELMTGAGLLVKRFSMDRWNMLSMLGQTCLMHVKARQFVGWQSTKEHKSSKNSDFLMLHTRASLNLLPGKSCNHHRHQNQTNSLIWNPFNCILLKG